MKQGLLAFQYEQEKGSTGMTALSGLMTYLELMQAAGLRSSAERHERLRDRGQGWTDSQMIISLMLLNLAGWRPQAQTRQVNLSLQVIDVLPDVDLDRMRMSQALGNVISNAIHCSEDGGNIVIRVGVEGVDALAISVTDDGSGIDAADLPHIFDRFYRTDQSRSRGIGGTGLGLAITRAIFGAHGGTIALASVGPGHGVTVNIRFPLNE